MDTATIRTATTAPAVAEWAQRIEALDRTGAVDGLAAQLQRLAGAGLDPIARDWLLDRTLHALARRMPTPAARRGVTELSGRTPEVFVRVDPDQTSGVPFFDPGATARFTLRTWERAGARDAALVELASGSSAPIERYAALAGSRPDDPVLAGIVEALAKAPADTLSRQRAPVAAALERGARVDEAALVIASRLRDAALLELVAGYAEPPVALAVVREARNVLGDAGALELLIAASNRVEVASAAVLAIGELARETPRAREHLFAALADPATGASAATALADLHDAAVVARLATQLRSSKSEPGRRHAVLALKLDGSAAARAELQRFASLQSAPAQLRSEVKSWLAN